MGAIDLRQVMAAILTFSMFAMLGNMIKREHIDPFLEIVPVSQTAEYDPSQTPKHGTVKLFEVGGSIKGSNETRKPCWRKDSLNNEKKSDGYVFFSLTHGPEYHASQVANAVMIVKHLRAALVLPDIKDSGDKRKYFKEIYDVNKFITSVGRVVKVHKDPPPEISISKLQIVRIPNQVSDKYISENIEPIFKKNHSVKIATYFGDTSLSIGKLDKEYQCLASFESLKFNEDFQDLVDSMVETLRSISLNSNGHFVAVDLRVEVLEKHGCPLIDQMQKDCYDAEEITDFLKKIGVDSNTTIYLTQGGWHSSLSSLRNHFSHTYNKDAIMPVYEKAKFLALKSETYEKAMDMYICSQADVFIPAFRSRFYTSVVGERIGNGKEHVLVPSKNASLSVGDSMSQYIVKKTHFAYSCFCLET